jgi:hypothetical protein
MTNVEQKRNSKIYQTDMENYELKIDTSPRINRINGQFLKNHKPFNKGVPMVKWMDGRKIKKVKKYLEIGRKAGNPDLPGANRIAIVGIKNGKLFPFSCAAAAEKCLKAKGIEVNQRNIRAVCLAKPVNNNGTLYIRKNAGGFQWFFADQPEKYKDFITQ